MTHLINRLLVEVNCSDQTQAFSMRHNFSQTLQKRIGEAVETVCAKYTGNSEYVQIDKLEIDLGKLKIETFDPEFDAAFSRKFEQLLTEKINRIPKVQRIHSLVNSHQELLTHFLQTGVLPWWADETLIDLNVISDQLLGESNTSTINTRLNTAIFQKLENELTEKLNRLTITAEQRVAFIEHTYQKLMEHFLQIGLLPLQSRDSLIDVEKYISDSIQNLNVQIGSNGLETSILKNEYEPLMGEKIAAIDLNKVIRSTFPGANGMEPAIKNQLQNLKKEESEVVDPNKFIPPILQKRKLQNSMLFNSRLLENELESIIGEEMVTHQDKSKNVDEPGISGIKDFLEKNRQQATVWKRIAFQLSEPVQQAIIALFEELTAAIAVAYALLPQIIKELNSTVGDYTTLRLKLQKLADNPVKLITANAPAIFAVGKSTLDFQAVIATHIADHFAAERSEYTTVVNAITEVTGKITFKAVANSAPITDKLAVLAFDPTQQHVFKINSAPEKLVVKLAGIVLLAPFLKPFFSILHLLEGNAWKNKQAQYKAVYLLNYLGSEQQKKYEYQLILEKLLCGIPPEEPIPTGVTLNKNELNEAAVLLKSVIEHWKVLKNTSANGLRESFFKRDGLLTAQENGWLLQLERKTLDVLLDSIPWGYSTVRLPWNNYMLTTEW